MLQLPFETQKRGCIVSELTDGNVSVIWRRKWDPLEQWRTSTQAAATGSPTRQGWTSIIVANGVDDDKKVATLLTVVGSATYQLLESLVFPDAPKDKTYAQLKQALRDQLSPRPLVIAQCCYRFYKREQQEGESVAHFLPELRTLARSCDFGDVLQTSLRDRLICGLRDSATVKKLLTIDGLTLADYQKRQGV